jgi:integrase
MPALKIKGSPYRVRSKGKEYWYAWRGGPRLFATPGTPAFLQELSEVVASRHRPDASTISGLIAMYRASDEFTDLAQSTKDLWSPWLDRIRDYFGGLKVKVFERPGIKPEIRRWHKSRKGTPRAAYTGMQVLSRLLAFAIAEGKLAGTNPCLKLVDHYESNRADMIWLQDDLDKLLAVASPEVGWAARLAIHTGLRRGDLLKLSWTHIKGLSIEIKTGKSKGRRTALIPIDPPLKALLDEIPKRATTVLTSSDRRPWTGDGFGSSWWKAIQEAGLRDRRLRFHDFRGTAATNFFRAGFTVREIAETLAWSEDRVERLIDRYVKRDEIMLDRIRRMEALGQG